MAASKEQLFGYAPFEPAGEWRTPECRVHRAAWLRYKPGVYAFVVGSTLMYVGKADVLHRRLRNYGNRCFRPKGRALRFCHEEIVRAVGAGQAVQVFAVVIDPSSVMTNTELEARMIRELSPPWNR